MAYSVGCISQPPTQGACSFASTAHTYSSSIRRFFRRHVDSARSPPPTMRIVCLSPPLPQYKHHTAQIFCVVALYSDPNERAYFWLPSSEAMSTHELLDSPEADRLYIDQGEIVRVRVERDEFCDDEPGPPKATEGVLISGQGQARRLPYTVTVSLQISSTASTRGNT